MRSKSDCGGLRYVNLRLYISYISLILLIIVGEGLAQSSEGRVWLPQVFGDNMVLLQEKPIPIWGTGIAGTQVKVYFAGQTALTKIASDGNWKVQLKPLKAGGPYKLRIVGEDTTVFDNVMVGEVWLCSGQSNMEMPVQGSWARVYNSEEVVQNANHPNIRLITVQKSASYTPEKDIPTVGWVECSPKTIAEFSAVAYFFGRELADSLKVPVGLINSSYGGTVAEAWTSFPSLEILPDFQERLKKMEKAGFDKVVIEKKYRTDYKNWQTSVLEKDPGMSLSDTLWNKPEVDDHSWKTMNLPSLWEDQGLPGFDGIVWFRKTIDLPEDFIDGDAELHIGPCDDEDITWLNGERIGSGRYWDVPRVYKLPHGLLHSGKNVIAVRVQDNQGGGGIWGETKDYYLLYAAGKQIPLNGEWKYHVGVALQDLPDIPLPPDNPNNPTVLYNAMIHPLVPFGIRGVIWYQGESNTARAYQYRTVFSNMIKDWRKSWHEEKLSFFFVQLANFMAQIQEPAESDWAELREAQMMALSLPGTGMAVTIDIGDADNIHPRNKQDVGRRLALWAENKVYGRDVVCSGPLYSNMEIKGHKIRIQFDHADDGLVSKDGGKLRGFAIAGKDHKFYWANAYIEDKAVVVSSEEVEEPVAVRYGWASNPDCNLYNRTGLPASPFRTDSWPGVTVENK